MNRFQIRPKIHKAIDEAKVVEVKLPWPHQCGCGSLEYVKYRAHYYCSFCCRRIKNPDYLYPGYTVSFRQIFNERLQERTYEHKKYT